MSPIPYDAVVVLGTKVLADGRPSRVLARRIDHGIALVRAGQADHLVVCGGLGTHPPTEAAVMAERAVAQGIASERILREDASTSTLENALFSAALLRERGWQRVLVVSDGYHLPRALYVFRRLGFAADGSAARPRPGGRQALRIKPLAWRLREVAAFPWYVYLVRVRERRRFAALRDGATEEHA